MNESANLLEAEFNACAGANYGVHALVEMDEGCRSIAQSLDSPLLYWLLSCEAVARGEDAGSVIAWLKYQIAEVTMISRGLGERLQIGFRDQWAAWLPIVLLTREAERVRAWECYNQAFPPLSNEPDAARLMLFRLLHGHGRSLYDQNIPGDQRFRYNDSPSHSVIKRVGDILRGLGQETGLPYHDEFEAMRKVLAAEVWGALGGRVSRGFAAAMPVFEDIVLALLVVAEWLTQQDKWQTRVSEFLKGYAERPEEKLSPSQMVLCGALYGYVRGYRRVGGGIYDLARRRLLSAQSVTIAINRLPAGTVRLPSVDPVIFYATEEGTRTAWSRPFIQVTRASQEMMIRRETSVSESAVEQIKHSESIECHEEINLHVARGLYRYGYESKIQDGGG